MDEDYYDEPCGSCDWCGSSVFPGQCGSAEGLCEQCAWQASLGEGSDDIGGGGWVGLPD